MSNPGGRGRQTFHMVTSCTIHAKLPLRPTKLHDGVSTSNYRILVRRVGFEPTNPSSSSCLDSKRRDLSAKFSRLKSLAVNRAWLPPQARYFFKPLKSNRSLREKPLELFEAPCVGNVLGFQPAAPP